MRNPGALWQPKRTVTHDLPTYPTNDYPSRDFPDYVEEKPVNQKGLSGRLRKRNRNSQIDKRKGGPMVAPGLGSECKANLVFLTRLRRSDLYIAGQNGIGRRERCTKEKRR